ncbi:zinc c6 transcription factor [Ophiostoma piceae UAMH 11346]|uniref:Zinc c6 transcription factor n=1 Tax=Ophiostoma piceae (strain UAMH 11346) TaxID=1262450 RepID=S3CC39_OPHP1|nr:zinc c6 transcription factor [Ophiostoma piceae UAMH 11346]
MNIFSKNRSSAGCWTCRLRRKKCDEARPICDSCAALDIECLYSEERPAWMDNGNRQRAMADRLKRDVKDRAAWRREKRFLRDIEKGTATITLGEKTGAGGTHIFAVAPGVAQAPAAAAEPDDQPPPNPAPSSAPVPAALSMSPPNLDEERDLNLMMVYLDYVFPFLYPFCRPSLLSSGRGWLLVLLMKNKAVFHSALSLSSFFMAVVATTNLQQQKTLNASGHGSEEEDASTANADGHSACLTAMLSELHKQQELSLRELQRAITAIRDRDYNNNNSNNGSGTAKIHSAEHLAESARVLESILQLLSFECVLQRLDSWHVHLEAALSLFEQIMIENSTDSAEQDLTSKNDSWSSIMNQLSPFPQGLGSLHLAPVPFSSDQAALKFHVSLLLFMDIVTSTTVEKPPRLLRFHQELVRPLTGTDGAENKKTDDPAQAMYNMFNPYENALLDMHEVVGVSNWVLLALTETAALAAWKKEAASAGRLTISELMARAAPIEANLRRRLASLEIKINTSESEKSPAGSLIHAHEHEAAHIDGAVHLSVDIASHIWGLGVLAYLLVVINGWQPAAEAIRHTADQALLELAALPSATCLRVAAWPLCVVGCLATYEQRPLYRGMVGQICGGQLLFGSVIEALRIMEAVWAAQDLQGNTADWDFGRCFSVLGRRAFLL